MLWSSIVRLIIMKYLDQCEFENKKIIIRVDFNVPLDDNLNILDDTRILESLPTIHKAISGGARSITLLSHLGRPKSGYNIRLSLKPIANYLSNILGRDIIFKSIGRIAPENIKNKSVFLLDNLRFDTREILCNEEFATTLASWGDVYINDAFGTTHRAHTSTILLPKHCKEKFAGLLIEKEILQADKLIRNPQRSFIAVIGGAKIGDKLSAINGLLDNVDEILFGGGVANTILLACGYDVGGSLLEKEQIDVVLNFMEKARKRNVSIILPQDFVIVKDPYSNDVSNKRIVNNTYNIDPEWKIVDIGPITRSIFEKKLAEAKTILWNGPMGMFEIYGLDNGTNAVLHGIEFANKNGCFSVIGGGDTVYAAKSKNYQNKVSHLSTGGGALLKYLAGETLPALEILK